MSAVRFILGLKVSGQNFVSKKLKTRASADSTFYAMAKDLHEELQYITVQELEHLIQELDILKAEKDLAEFTAELSENG